MRYCNSCGELIEIESKFCPSCGVKQSSDNLNKSNQTYPEPNSEFVPENVGDVFRLDDKKIIDVSLLDEDLLLDIISNAYKGVEFEYLKYALIEAKVRGIKLNKTLERRLTSNYDGLLTEELLDSYIAKKNNLLDLIKAKIIVLDKELVIDVASNSDEDLIEDLAKMGNSPSFYHAKYILLEMLSRDMNEFTKVSNQILHIDYISELKPNFDKIKKQNELAIDLKKTNKRLDKYEKGILPDVEEENVVIEDVEFEIEPPISFFERNKANLRLIAIVLPLSLLIYYGCLKKSNQSSYSPYTPANQYNPNIVPNSSESNINSNAVKCPNCGSTRYHNHETVPDMKVCDNCKMGF
jgi:hypothetical protein